MVITHPHGSTFLIQTKNSEEVEIAFDPLFEKSKLAVPRKLPHILLKSVVGSLPKELVEKKVLCVDSPGEFELKGIFIVGIPCENIKTQTTGVLYVIESEGIHLCAINSYHQEALSTEQLEKIGSVDVLIISVGEDCLTAGEAAELVGELEPRIIILNPCGETKESTGSLNAFVKKLGIHPQTMDKIKIGKKDLPQEETKLVILEEKG